MLRADKMDVEEEHEREEREEELQVAIKEGQAEMEEAREEGLIDGMVIGDDPIATGSDEHYQYSDRGYVVLGDDT